MSTRVCPYCFGSGVVDQDAETPHTCVACSGAGIQGREYMADDAEEVA